MELSSHYGTIRQQVWLEALKQKQAVKPVTLEKAVAYADEILREFDSRFSETNK